MLTGRAGFQARFDAGLPGAINESIDLNAKLVGGRQNLFQFVKKLLVGAILQVFDEHGGEALDRIEGRAQVMPQPLTEGFNGILLAWNCFRCIDDPVDESSEIDTGRSHAG